MSHAILEECVDAGIMYNPSDVRGTLRKLIDYHIQQAMIGDAQIEANLKSTSEKVVQSSSQSYVVSTDVYWRYDPAPMAAKIFLLTEGGCATDGVWKPRGGFIGWHPLLKRDHEKELAIKHPTFITTRS